MTTPSIKPIHPDIPTDRAWQTGRRLYVRCGYKTQLNNSLRDLGAHWDTQQRALWIGSAKREAVIDLLLLAQDHKKHIEEIKTAGRWVRIPYEAALIRAKAKELGAKWDRDSKCWAMPSDASLAEVTGLLAIWQTKRDADQRAAEEQRKADTEAEAKEQRQRDALAAARRREELIAASGRASTGVVEQLLEISTRRMNKYTAAEAAHRVGSVIKLADGRRALVTAVKIWFTNDEMASSVCWHAETHDEAHWDFSYDLVIVNPTEEELDAEQAKAAERLDAGEIHAVMSQAAELTGSRADDRWTEVPDEERAGTITATTGIAAVIRAGHLILTTDGRVIWQHPGYYDDYVRSEGITTDPDLARRVREVLSGGNRERVIPGQMPTYYKVHVNEVNETNA